MDSPLIRSTIDKPYHTIHRGSSPLVATSIHAGKNLRQNLLDICALSEAERLYEEDPYTDYWVPITDNQVYAHHSRFEIDLNRSRDKTIYKKPADAWGLKVWKEELSEKLVNESLSHYDEFYSDVKNMLTEIQKKHDCFVLFDIHSYNHKREGPDGPDADPEKNPEIIIGTGNMNRTKWAPVVEAMKRTIESYNYNGRKLDVRENVKFSGGNFMRWIHNTFPDKACAISIEVKKFYMNEWTGEPDRQQLEEIKKVLKTTIKPVLKALAQVAQTQPAGV